VSLLDDISVNILCTFHAVCIRLLSSGDSAALLFAPVEVIKSCSEIQVVLVSTDSGVIISSKQSSVLFPRKSRAPTLFTKPATVIVVSSDR
jgi:CMP-N-acetylneuraminic acid synthetase